MNEDERGITPANVTAITVEPLGEPGIQSRSWRVIIEQGNGDVIKMFELTEMERIQLACMICTEPGEPPTLTHIGFLDFARDASEPGTDAPGA